MTNDIGPLLGRSGISSFQAGASRATHDGNAGFTIPSYAKHYWPCDEYKFGFASYLLADVAGGYHIPPTGISHWSLQQPYHCVIEDQPRTLQGSERFECFSGQKDWAIIVGSKAINSGCFEFTLGSPVQSADDPDEMFLKVQPYYLAINYGPDQNRPWHYVQTLQDTSMINRVVGTEYLIAHIRRGSQIEHWVNGVMVGSNDLTLMLTAAGRTYGADVIAGYNKIINGFRPTAKVRMGHSATTAIVTASTGSNPDYDYDHYAYQNPTTIELASQFTSGGSGVVNEPTDYAGIAICTWDTGSMPDATDTATGLNQIAANWFAGTKTIEVPAWG